MAKVDMFAETFPNADAQQVLVVQWSNYMLRHRQGGNKVWRESVFKELMYINEFYNMVHKRITTSVKGDKRVRQQWLDKVCSDINRCMYEKDAEPFESIDTEIAIDNHRLARYVIRPMAKIQFTLSGAEYVIGQDGLKKVGGEVYGKGVFDKSKSKLYGGNAANPDGSYKSNDERARAIIEQRAKTAEQAMQAAIEHDVPFSAVDTSGVSPEPEPTQTSSVKLSKKEQKELDKFGLTLDNIPAVGEKPSGFQNKVWKQIHNKLAV